jgi:hypothetical protein
MSSSPKCVGDCLVQSRFFRISIKNYICQPRKEARVNFCRRRSVTVVAPVLADSEAFQSCDTNRSTRGNRARISRRFGGRYFCTVRASGSYESNAGRVADRGGEFRELARGTKMSPHCNQREFGDRLRSVETLGIATLHHLRCPASSRHDF